MKRLVLAFAIILFAGTATARDVDTNDQRCRRVSTGSDHRIGACAWLIDVVRSHDEIVSATTSRSSARSSARPSARNDSRAVRLAAREVPNSDQLFEPNIPVAYNNRGNAYFVKRQYDQAIAQYDAAIRLRPDFTAAYYNRGLAHANTGHYDRAADDFGAAAHLTPNHARAHNSLAWLLATAPRTPVRNGARAIESAARAISLRDIAEYRDTLAAAYAEAGRFADAVREQARAIKMARREGFDDLTGWRDRLRLYERGQPFRE